MAYKAPGIYAARSLKRVLALLALASLSACASVDRLEDVRGKPVPTASFLFFDKDAAEPQEESMPTLRQAAAFLVQYDNTVARLIGHVAPDEPFGRDPTNRLDTRRAAAVGALMMQLGVDGSRIEPFSAGQSENLSSGGGNPNMDRRVDILFGVR
jgi:outer membrane protein OmpA-like peptidoglycan-associated protein